LDGVMAVTPVRTFNVRLSDEEFAKITAKAKDLGLSKAGLIRRLLERAELIEASPKKTSAKKSTPAPKRARRDIDKPNFKKSMMKDD